MKLYFHPLSGNSRRALLTAAHLDSPVDRIVVDLVKGEQRMPPHLARNPNGTVPVLEDDGFLLWESRAIMQYLADKAPPAAGESLYPRDLRGRAEVNRWLSWDTAHNSQAAAALVQENFVKPLRGEATNPVEVARGEALFERFAPVLDTHLATRTWVAADRVTLADYSIAAAYGLAKPARFPISHLAHLNAWLDRVAALPAWQQTAPQLPPR